MNAMMLSALLTAEDFLPLAMRFSGLAAEEARPIVEKLFSAMLIGLAALPLVLVIGWFVFRSVRRNLDFWSRPVVFTVLAVLVALLSFPDPVRPTLPGLDQSWQWGLDHTALCGSLGRDFCFTYGPLGFLLYPHAHLGRVLLSLSASLVLLSLWTWALIALYRSGRRYRPAAWLLLATLLFPQETTEWRWVALSVVLAALPVAVRWMRQAGTMFVLAGATLAFTCLMKFNAITIGISAQILAMAAFLTRERGRWRTALVLPISAGIVFAVLSFALFDSIPDFVRWVRGSLEVAAGYNRNMMQPRSYAYLVFPFLASVLVLVTVLIRSRRPARALPLSVVFAPVVFCAVKYAIVRQGVAPLFYLLSVFLALSTAAQPALRRRFAMVMAALYVVVMGFILPRAVAGISPTMFPGGLNPAGLVRTLTLPSTLERTRRQSEEALRECRLPDTWRKLIGSESVLFLPHEFAPAMADRYELCFLPALQLYTACHPALDADCAAMVGAVDGPRWIVLDVDPCWCGYFVNYPRTWETVFRAFETRCTESGRVLLRRREGVLTVAETSVPVRTVEAVAGEWIDCREFGSSPVTVSWAQTVWGRFSTLFLRNTETHLALRYADGSESEINLVPDCLTHPFRLDRIAVTEGDFIKVFSEGATRPPVAIRFSAETPSLYEPKVGIGIGK